LLDVVNAERGLEGVFAELGQDRMRAWFRYHAARVWAVVGAVERAKELLGAADQLGPGPTAYERAMAEFCRTFVHDAGKDQPTAAAAIAAAHDLFAAAGDKDGQRLCDLVRVEILAAAGDAAGVDEVIAGWTGDTPGSAKLAPVAVRVRLFARFLLGETALADDLARNLADEPDPVAVVAMLRHLGRVCRERGDTDRAEHLFRAACRELPKVAGGFGAAEDVATFQSVKDELLQGYRASVAAAGVELDSELPAWEAAATEPAAATAAAQAALDRRQLRWGIGLIAAKVLVLLAVAGAGCFLFVGGLHDERPWGPVAFLVLASYFCFGAVYTAFPILYLPVALIGRWVRPGAFTKVGKSTFGMAVMAWVLAPVMTGLLWFWRPDLARPDPPVSRSFFEMNSRPEVRPDPWADLNEP
jgi:hypothetical protein